MSLLFDKYREKNKIIYKVLGIKIRVNEGDSFFKLVLRKVLSVYRKIQIKIFVNKNKEYYNQKNLIRKRLFLTTGNISLINAIATIRQENNNCEQYEDYLYVQSININQEFINFSQKIAALHNFKKVYFFTKDKAFKTMSESKDLIIKDLIDLKLYDIDEIYAVNIIQFINIVNILYKSIPCCYIEESAFGTFSKGDYQNVQKFIMPTYLDKIDNRGFSDSEKNKFVNLKSEYFIQVADECVKMYPLNIDCAPEDKIIIFCGTWGDLQCYTESEFAQKEEEIIEKLQNKGFVVYFKPHPRDNREYKETANFKILKTKLPLECYVINNLVATVSLLSFSSLQSFHYRKVPGFVCLNYFELKDEKTLALLSEYTPSVDLILDINTNEYSLQALKNEVTRRYLDFLNSKPMLSKNATFDKFNK